MPLSNVGDSATSVTLSAPSPRDFWAVYNDSPAYLRIALAETASSTSFTALVAPYTLWSLNKEIGVSSSGKIYSGIITGIWDADAGGSARITEI